jgi:preprotein translocase subunit SecE
MVRTRECGDVLSVVVVVVVVALWFVILDWLNFVL